MLFRSFILPCLGTALYNRLQDGIVADDLTALEQDILDTYITPTLVYYVLSELPMGLSYQFYNKGLIRKSGDGQENPSASEMIDVADRYKGRAEFYKQRMVKFLKEKAVKGLLNLYLNPGNTIDTMIPENQAYTTSIWLGDSDICCGKTFEEKYQGNINRCCGE